MKSVYIFIVKLYYLYEENKLLLLLNGTLFLLYFTNAFILANLSITAYTTITYFDDSFMEDLEWCMKMAPQTFDDPMRDFEQLYLDMIAAFALQHSMYLIRIAICTYFVAFLVYAYLFIMDCVYDYVHSRILQDLIGWAVYLFFLVTWCNVYLLSEQLYFFYSVMTLRDVQAIINSTWEALYRFM